MLPEHWEYDVFLCSPCAAFNGTFPIVAIFGITQFTYIAGISGLAASGGGTAASATATTTPHGFNAGQLVATSGINAAKGGSWPRRAAKRIVAFAIDAAITAALCASGHCK